MGNYDMKTLDINPYVV